MISSTKSFLRQTVISNELARIRGKARLEPSYTTNTRLRKTKTKIARRKEVLVNLMCIDANGRPNLTSGFLAANIKLRLKMLDSPRNSALPRTKRRKKL